MAHAQLCQARQQLKGSQGDVNIRFPTTASSHNQLVTQEMCQLYKQTLYCWVWKTNQYALKTKCTKWLTFTVLSLYSLNKAKCCVETFTGRLESHLLGNQL